MKSISDVSDLSALIGYYIGFIIGGLVVAYTIPLFHLFDPLGDLIAILVLFGFPGLSMLGARWFILKNRKRDKTP